MQEQAREKRESPPFHRRKTRIDNSDVGMLVNVKEIQDKMKLQETTESSREGDDSPLKVRWKYADVE